MERLELFATRAVPKPPIGEHPIHITQQRLDLAELQNPANLGYVLWDTFLVEPVFEESGFAEVLFPEGHRWLYYFNRSLVFEGRGQRQALGFKLSEAPLFVRSDSVVPVGDELWLVHLSPGRHARQVVAGDYSDSVAVSSSGRPWPGPW